MFLFTPVYTNDPTSKQVFIQKKILSHGIFPRNCTIPFSIEIESPDSFINYFLNDIAIAVLCYFKCHRTSLANYHFKITDFEIKDNNIAVTVDFI